MNDEAALEQTLWDAASPTETHRPWRMISDGVMGGRSQGSVVRDAKEGRPCVRLRGTVSLENGGGFLQMVQDIDTSTAAELPHYRGVVLDVYGNGETYGAHLRSKDNWLPWQAYRASFATEPTWQTIHLPFDSFDGYRTSTPLDPARLKRISIVAIGREFNADLCIGRLGFYKDSSRVEGKDERQPQ